MIQKALSVIPGECRLFNPSWEDYEGVPIRVPHMGWNQIELKKDCVLFKDIDPEANFYFVHSLLSCSRRTIHHR